MTTRDRSVLIVILLIAVLGGFWFAVVSPKRKDAKDLAAQVETAQQRLDTARQNAASAAVAKRDYDSSYATVARLGKAVPVDDDVPSLVYQLDAAARGGHVDFASIRMAGAATPASTPAAAATTSANASAATSDSAGGSTSAPATQTAVATLPPGASVGPAGLPTMPFTFQFNGTFFELQNFLDEINRFISVKSDQVRVQGRLLTIDGVDLGPGAGGFPRVKAEISATAFLLPAGQGLLGGATAAAPTNATTALTTTPGGEG